MKKIFIFLAFFAATFTFAQNINAGIQEEFNTYFTFLKEKNIDKALDYINPKLFEVIPKGEMKTALELVYNMPNIEFKMYSPQFVNFDDVKKIDNVSYVRFQIISPIEMKFNEMDMTGEMIAQMMAAFEKEFGKGNVSFNDQSKFFKLNAKKIIIASSEGMPDH